MSPSSWRERMPRWSLSAETAWIPAQVMVWGAASEKESQERV